MHLHTITLLLAAGLAPAHVQAAAIPATNTSSLVLYHTRILDTGTLEYWGIPQPEDAASVASATSDFDWNAGWGDSETETYSPAPIQARCGSNQYHCADSNLADSNACAWLISIFARNRRGAIDPNVRGVVHNRDGGSCVISWHDHVPAMVNGYLIAAAEKVLFGCGLNGSGRVSGYATDVSLNGVCTIQCLSSARSCF